ncbi:tyrosine-type recombinase/integrase [Pacificimonas sp. ICDLI1SI03]
MGKLNAAKVRALREPGRYQDGRGLMLDVKASGSRSWVLRLQSAGRRRDYGLGSLEDVSLAEAREAAADYRRQLRAGVDPIAAKEKANNVIPTFSALAKAVHAEQQRGWKNGKHGAQWLSTLRTYAFPTLGDMLVSDIEAGQVRDVLSKIWLEKPETARRVRQRIGTVLDYAYSKGWRDAEAPMRSITKGLPRQPRKTGHFAAMPYEQVPAFMEMLRSQLSVGRLALEALILTATRSGEIRGACWSEIDLDARTWTVPAVRMKMGVEHVVPLSEAALDVFQRAAAVRRAGTDLVFPGAVRGKPLSDMTLLKILRDQDLKFTVHGFRSSFRDWVADKTSVPGEVAEAALAHATPNKVEAAYKRTVFLEKRRELMGIWGAYISANQGNL